MKETKSKRLNLNKVTIQDFGIHLDNASRFDMLPVGDTELVIFC